MKFKLVILGLHVLTCILNAQPDFRPGFIIKNSGDTLFGAIDYRGDYLMSRRCRFKDNNNDVVEYSPDDLSAFRIADNKFFISKEIKHKKVFLEFLIDGVINIYYLRDENGDHYYIDKEHEEFAEMPYEQGTKYINYERRFYESKKHIGLLTYYTQDAPEFKNRIKAIKKPEHQSLIRLARDYHKAVCENEPCIIFEKKIPLLKVSFQPFAGLTKYKGYYKFVKEFGGYMYLWAPRTNEKLFFKTGLVYSKIEEEGEALHITKIPVQLQYVYPAYRLRPEISGGVNMHIGRLNEYKSLGNSVCMNAGLNFVISRTTSLSTGFDCEFTPLRGIFIDEDYKFRLISYSYTIGVKVEL